MSDMFRSMNLIGIISTLVASCGLFACAHGGKSKISTAANRITFYIYTPHFAGAEQGEESVRRQYHEFVEHLGSPSRYGSIGVALNYPYTAFVVGDRPENFAPDKSKLKLYELNVRVAHEMGFPVMVGFNGGPWAEVTGPFNAYWKTLNGGRYLARYSDGQVNESIHSKGWIKASVLRSFLDAKPYDLEKQKNALFLTLSSAAEPIRKSRLRILDLALQEWEQINEKYPNTIQAFTTDSEVSDFSFRSQPSGDALPIGYESFVTQPYCNLYKIENCESYFRSHHFTYESEEDRQWFHYRSDIHRNFVADTVAQIRINFPETQIYTHQLGTLDGDFIESYRRRDLASPQETAFVPGAKPGVTAYIYGKRDEAFRRLVSELSDKSVNGWALTEFNPGKDWKGSKAELTSYTKQMLEFLSAHKVSVVALLAWESNSLDAGIKDSGIDDGIRDYLNKGR